jgi:hypothetical protein
MAEIKKATPEKVYLKSEKGWESKYGTMYDHVVKFPGSDIEFVYTSKSKEQDKFKAGEEVEFEYEKKSGETNGVHWEQHKIKPVSNKQQGGRGGYVFNLDNEKQKQKVSAVAYSTSYVKDLISMDKLPVDKENPLKSMKDYITELASFMWEEIDKVK